jgi:heterodisulfide reductase subunit C
MNANNNNELDPKFKYEVAIHPGGENIKLCFACGTCTAGCPVSEIDPEFNPRKIIRQVLLGMRKETLSPPVIWRCAQCYSCTAKCPQNVKFREVLRGLREMAVEEGYAEPERIQEMEELGRLTQKLRRNLANALATDRGTYDELKKKIEQIAG